MHEGVWSQLFLFVHFLSFYVELLQEIGEAADGEDARQRASDPRAENVPVNETGGDPGTETEWTGEQFANGASQTMAFRAFFHFAGTAFTFYFGKRRAKGARHFVLRNDAAQFLSGESKQREIFRLDSLG